MNVFWIVLNAVRTLNLTESTFMVNRHENLKSSMKM